MDIKLNLFFKKSDNLQFFFQEYKLLANSHIIK